MELKLMPAITTHSNSETWFIKNLFEPVENILVIYSYNDILNLQTS